MAQTGYSNLYGERCTQLDIQVGMILSHEGVGGRKDDVRHSCARMGRIGLVSWWESCNRKTWFCMSADIGWECFGEKKGCIDRTLFRFSSESRL